jgi:hypothetical protein
MKVNDFEKSAADVHATSIDVNHPQGQDGPVTGSATGV